MLPPFVDESEFFGDVGFEKADEEGHQSDGIGPEDQMHVVRQENEGKEANVVFGLSLSENAKDELVDLW